MAGKKLHLAAKNTYNTIFMNRTNKNGFSLVYAKAFIYIFMHFGEILVNKQINKSMYVS